MEESELDVIDILAYITENLEEKFKSAKDADSKRKIFIDFLNKWDAADPQLDAIKQLKVEFQNDLDWFNVSKPLQSNNLRGKLVLLDFFTYCCINCMHVLPELRNLENLFSVERGLVVIGVHSPKFENEKIATNILSATQRYGINHPIVNDPQSTLWRSLGIRCWPTLLVLSPNGYPIALCMGEGHGGFLESFIEHALDFFHSKNKIGDFPLPLCTSNINLPASRLSFPAKIARSDDEKFALSDAGNNRIIVFNRAGIVLKTIGGFSNGFVDGDLITARFNSPQGLTFLNNDVIIVADTENHAIRKINLSAGLVETLAGTGQQGNDRCGGKSGPLQSLSSPWDVAVFRTRDMDMSFHLDEQSVPEKTIILISMSGTHQIWGYFPDGIILWKFRRFEPLTCVALVGNGMEENRNNSYPQNAAFAQPSGISMANNFLFIADSESSSIRKVSMLDGKVTGVVGGDRNPLNLFAYGDVDGKQYNAKLQHPLGVAFNAFDNRIYVADTYNHKIKMIDCTDNTIKTITIKDSTGNMYKFSEPAGLCFDGSGKYLFVSDTNNHIIQIVNMHLLTTERFVLDFSQITQKVGRDDIDSVSLQDKMQLQTSLPLSTYNQLALRIVIKLQGYKYTSESPQKWSINTKRTSFLVDLTNSSGTITPTGDFIIQLHSNSDASLQKTICVDIALSLCNDNQCLLKRFTLVINDTEISKSLNLNSKAIGNLKSAEELITIHVTPKEITL